MIFPAGPALLAAAGEFVHRGPSSRLRRFHAGTALLITGFDVRRLPLLLVGITGFIALRHGGYFNCRFGAHSFSLTPAGVHPQLQHQ